MGLLSRWLIFVGLLILSFNVNATRMSAAEFSTFGKWQKLIHFSEKKIRNSYITSKQFFLSEKRLDNSFSELEATIDAFYLKENGRTPHAQCIFPARLLLIKKHMDLSSYGKLPSIKCPRYRQWRSQLNTESVSVVFASGYMSNPASMYGHLFLKFNRSSESTDLLNTSVNYGAIVPENENPITYIFKGVFGGYNAAYSDQQFYRHHHNYGDVELRDMWEYKLALSRDDVNLVTAHLWEVLGNNFDYYFIDENCAFHIAKLLEIVLDETIISENSFWVIPSAVAKGIADVTYQKKPLLKESKFIPSRESVLWQYYQQLSKQQQNVAKTLIFNNMDFSVDTYQKLDIEDKKTIVEVLFAYYNVLKQKESTNSIAQINIRKLLLERVNLPTGKVKWGIKQGKKAAPHMGMSASKSSLGVLSRANNQQYITAGFRMTYFDDLSSSVARSPFTNLEMVDLEIATNKDKIKVLKADIVDINSLYQRPIPWSNSLASAWAVRVGYEQLNNNCMDCGIYFSEGFYGKSIRLGDAGLAYAMLGGRIFAGIQDDVMLSAKLGYIADFSDRLKGKFEYQENLGVEFNESYLQAEINYALSPNFEVRVLFNKKETNSVAIKFNYFWGF